MDTTTMSAAVFVQTNATGENRIVAFGRANDGTLSELGSYPTGGAGDGVAHLTSQGSVALTSDGRHLLVTNASSGDISLFDISTGTPALAQTVATGPAPKSIAEHAGLVYVLNTGGPSIVGFRIADGRLEPLPETTRSLADGSDPAQIGFTPDGSALVVTQRGTDAVALYPVDDSGRLGEPQVQ